MLTRTAHPVPDLGRFLLGTWKLARLGWDSATGRTMRLRGTASFSARAADVLFQECGTVTFGTYLGEAVRRYVLHPLSPGTAEVRFEDGTLFHYLDLTKGVALVRHHCAPDRYVGRYHVLGPDFWVLSWHVTGPRKRQLITSRFIRSGEGAS